MKFKIIPYNPKLKQLARELRANMTVSEVILWNEIKQKKILGFDFDRQRPVDQFIVDFYCKELMLAIEIDGITHDHPVAIKKDKLRQERLESFGIHFLRFTDYEVKEDLNSVMDRIVNWIEEKTKNEPTPSPSEEGNYTAPFK